MSNPEFEIKFLEALELADFQYDDSDTGTELVTVCLEEWVNTHYPDDDSDTLMHEQQRAAINIALFLGYFKGRLHMEDDVSAEEQLYKMFCERFLP